MAHQRLRIVLLGALLIGLAMTIAACSGAVAGEVSSKGAQKPVPQATVQVGSEKVVTDTSGHFTLSKVDTGTVAVSVHASGYGPYAGSLNVQRGDNTLNVVLENGAVTGVITENAEVTKGVKKATVTVGGLKASVEGRKFTLSDVPVGQQQLVVVSPGHAKYKTKIEVQPGGNTADVSLDLTPVETYMRYYMAYRFERWKEAHRFVHADVKKHESYDTFIKDMKQGGIVVGIKVFGVKAMNKWHSPWAKKTYRHIAAIDRAVRYQDSYGSYSDNYTQHWQQIKGRWYIIYDWRD